MANVEKIIQELNKCKTPLEMELFVGGENEKFQTKAMQIGLNPNNIEYLQNLQSEIGADLLKKKKNSNTHRFRTNVFQQC